tara:strand:+ start:10410 stop:10649 length:240 start_codon:yes stop_codon:yes gene_type:complete
MRKDRIRSLIHGYLAEFGRKNTVEITEYINRIDRGGTSVKQIGPILSREPRFVKVGTEKVQSLMGGSYQVKLWELRDRT